MRKNFIIHRVVIDRPLKNLENVVSEADATQLISVRDRLVQLEEEAEHPLYVDHQTISNYFSKGNRKYTTDLLDMEARELETQVDMGDSSRYNRWIDKARPFVPEEAFEHDVYLFDYCSPCFVPLFLRAEDEAIISGVYQEACVLSAIKSASFAGHTVKMDAEGVLPIRFDPAHQ